MADELMKYVAGVGLVPLTQDDIAQNAQDQASVNTPVVLVPETISARQFMQQLAVQGDITWDECFAYLGQGVIPTIFANAIAQIPTDKDVNAQNKAKAAFIGANSFDRHNPTTEALGALIGKSPADLDALWVAAAAIQ